MNGWRCRVALGLLMTSALATHAAATATLPNNPAGMLAFHGSAATVDLLLLYLTPWFVSGRLCDDMERLNQASIVGNALGWGLYMAYAPPTLYNALMWGLTWLQWLRLALDDDAIDSLWSGLVRRLNPRSALAH
jgi:hypothetical protein